MSVLFINEVLTPTQKAVFAKLLSFKQIGILAGGTALALQIKHRRSYDFDIFCSDELSKTLSWKARNIFGQLTIINRFEDNLTFITSSGAKITFVYYPFPNLYPNISTSVIKLFHCRDIALDEAYTIGRRAQYRDYVDLFFLMKEKKITIDWIIKNAVKKFESEFPKKIFLEQIVYFKDLKIFPVEFLREKYTPGEIKSFFEKVVEKYTSDKIK